MATNSDNQRPGSSLEEPQATTPAATVIGWTVGIAALLPLVMGLHGDGSIYLVVGAALAAFGALLIVIGRYSRRPRT